MEKELIKLYTNDNLSINELTKIFKIGKLKVKKILLDNNIKLKTIGGQKKITDNKIFDLDVTNKSIKCKKCNSVYDDVENKSGIAIQHINECYSDVKIPSSYIRRNYIKQYGTLWHLQYFDIVDSVDKETIKCPMCDWKSLDLTNKTGAFTKHVEKEHGGITKFIELNSDYEKYFNVFNLKKERKVTLKNDYVHCRICGEKLKYVNNKHLEKHNITLHEYKQEFLGQNFLSESTTNKLKDSYENNLKHYERQYQSKPEIEITNIIKSYGYHVLNNNKLILDGVELDIYIPDLNIAIEYNGLFYHNENMGKDKWFHLNKQKLAKSKGINLIHIFEDEWIHKKDICINKIIHLINKNNNKKIFGRKCVIKNISKDISESFLNKNHIQSYAPQTTYNIGAYYNNELIGVMTFLKINEHTVTLNRFATHNNYITPGVASKIFTYFTRYHKNITITTFADRRWITDENNNIYTKLGFKLVKTLNPDYRYFNPKIARNNRIHKFNLRKKALLKAYPDILNKNMTENEMTKLTGYYKIWDCGLFKYEYKT